MEVYQQNEKNSINKNEVNKELSNINSRKIS